jgi:L-2-hydroxyglutarate oxidase LhgO
MTNPDIVDVAIVGAGVVGLAVARACAQAGLDTVVIERHGQIGSETSSRNSGVIHSGIYYPVGSLKSELCVAGRRQLYEYCETRGVAHRRCGKIIVAQDHQVDDLRALQARAVANGVDDLQWLDARQVGQLEPEVRCTAALLSPSTGIVDQHELMTALLGDLEAAGGALALHTETTRVRSTKGGFEVDISCAGDADLLAARNVVNASGLSAVDVTRRIDGYPIERIPELHFAKGVYFSCSGHPFQRLVYPMPDDASLGVHATLDLGGALRFGPDVEWTRTLDYAVSPARAAAFYASIREYWPGLPDGALQPAFAGIRPKLAGPDQPPSDFRILDSRVHGLPGLVNLLGIESPGLTAALAIGERVRQAIYT